MRKTRHELVGWHWNDLEARDTVAKTCCELPCGYPPEMNRSGMRQGDIHSCVMLATFRHLEFDLEPFDLEHYLRIGNEVAIDYFYGNWSDDDTYRDIVDKALRSEYFCWSDPFRDGLFCAIMSKDRATREKLCDWVEADMVEDTFILDDEYAVQYVHILLADYLRKQPMAGIEAVEPKVLKERRKRPKLLLNVFHSIRDCDQEKFTKALTESLKHYWKVGLGAVGISTLIAVDESILNAVAVEAGLSSADVPEKLMVVVADRKTLGLVGEQ